jgi:hypothetical protein
MRRRMPTGRHHPSGGRYRLDAGIVRSQYPRVVSIGGHRRKFGTYYNRIIPWIYNNIDY